MAMIGHLDNRSYAKVVSHPMCNAVSLNTEVINSTLPKNTNVKCDDTEISEVVAFNVRDLDQGSTGRSECSFMNMDFIRQQDIVSPGKSPESSLYGDVRGDVFTVPVSNSFQLLSLLNMHDNLGDPGGLDHTVQPKYTGTDTRTDSYHEKHDLASSDSVLQAVDLNSLVQENNVSSCNAIHPITIQSYNQLGGNFSCITVTDFRLYTGPPVIWQSVLDIIQAHNLIRFSCVPKLSG